MIKYVITFLPKDHSAALYIKDGSNIDLSLYQRHVDDKIPVTANIEGAYLFDSFEQTAQTARKLRYYYRQLFDIDIGVKRIDINEITANTNNYIT